ncbi:hypothetical protein VTN96DRAFT_1852 [Rasamsonia emersonii]
MESPGTADGSAAGREGEVEQRESGAQVLSSPTEAGPSDYRAQDDNERTHDGNDDDDGEDGEESDEDEEDEEDEDEEEEDEEPRLKYAYLTRHLSSLYRNGDATSAFLAGGDKMIVGTHNGNVHVLSLPHFRPLRAYRAHSASVTSVSISPFPPPLPTVRPNDSNRILEEEESIHVKSPSGSLRGGKSKGPQQPVLPATPSNSIYIATSSIDGNVCVASLVDPKDILLRNFGRPVQAVALSPEYKSDRTYLSGGRAGQLILTVGGRIGASTNSTTLGGAAAAASGWLGSIGLGTNTGKDTVLHSGEGAINTIKWSLSGKYVAWVNEEGIKIMRSHLHLESSESEHAWTRINHIDRPNRPGWEEMAGVWKAHLEWVDESSLESDENAGSQPGSAHQGDSGTSSILKANQKVEKLVVGWGGTIWVINVFPDRVTPSASRIGEKRLGAAEVATILRTDCIISGVSMHTRNLLLVLAYIEAEEDESEQQGSPRPRSSHRQRAAEPELRLIDIETKEEISADTLSVSRYENLSSSDYHMCRLPAPKISVEPVQRGALGVLGNGLWDATMYPARLFSSSASIRSNASSGDKGSGRAPSSFISNPVSSGQGLPPEILAVSGAKGPKIFIHSPYDCVVAVQRDLADRLSWLESHARYEEAWHLIDEHPEAANPATDRTDSVVESSTRSRSSLADFFADDTSSVITVGRASNTIPEKEKRRIGELWLEQLVSENQWEKAGEVCGKVLDTVTRWEHWIWTFVKNGKFDEITPYVPVELHPPLPSLVYEVILGHYVARDRSRFKELLDQWSPDLFDTGSVTAAIENQLKSETIVRDSEDWQILMESLAKLFSADGRHREALRCYIRLQDAEAALSIIRDYRLVDAVSDDIFGFILLRVSKQQIESAPLSELEEATAEPIKILVREAYNGIVRPETVVSQLQDEDRRPYLYFYLRALWHGEAHPSGTDKPHPRGRGRRARDAAEKLAADEGKTLVEPFADTALELFAAYDRSLLMEFLQSSTAYSFDAACTICETRHYTQELIYLLSKTGQTKRALNLILSDLQDVSQAISFAKSQDDPDLWEDLLNYSMNKPSFIHALLTEAGTSIDPIKLVRRIPSGLEIEGLREGLTRMIRDHDIQASISQGAAKVLQSEVAVAMDTLRRGQRRGIKFDVIKPQDGQSQGAAIPVVAEVGQKEAGGDHVDSDGSPDSKNAAAAKSRRTVEPGRCGGCYEAFHENEKEILVGFACGHVFHLSHLQGPTQPTGETPPAADDITERLPSPSPSPSKPATADADPEADEPGYFTTSRTVGPKVTTARLIRDRIGEGCRICALGRQVEKAAAPDSEQVKSP